jgi:hypothetical protein
MIIELPGVSLNERGPVKIDPQRLQQNFSHTYVSILLYISPKPLNGFLQNLALAAFAKNFHVNLMLAHNFSMLTTVLIPRLGKCLIKF